MPGLSYSERIDVRSRLWRVIAVTMALFMILVLRLVHLQVIEGVYYRARSEDNQFRPERLIAPRGLIVDRNGKILVDNRPAFALCAVPAEMGDVEQTLARLASLIPVDTNRVENLVRAPKRNPYERVVIERDADFHQVTIVEENSVLLPGIITSVRPKRRYVMGEYAGNLLGYIGEVNEAEILRSAELQPGDLIGRGGVEQIYDDQLRGKSGGLLIEVFAKGRPQMETDMFGRAVARIDSLGRPLRTERYDAVPGHNVVLTIDSALQCVAEDALGDLVGSVVVMDARNGAVLALASKPSYDPGTFVSGDPEAVRKVLAGENHPMLNRGFQSTYAPASTFKTVVAVAGLESGEITAGWRAVCGGSYRIGESRPFRCWKRDGHGSLDLVDALTYSCDVFFYILGYQLGIDRIAHYARLFGLGSVTGLDLPGDKPGVVPSRAWKRARFANTNDPGRGRWYPGETLNVAIGQGWLLTTPLQMARVAAVFVNGGYLVTPHIADRLIDAGGETVDVLRPEVPSKPIVSMNAVETVRKGMLRAVEKTEFPTGTGHLAKVDGLAIIGKTGTGQVVSGYDQSDDPLQMDIPYENRDNAWFIGGVLDESFPIAFAVLVEHGGHGGDRAAPIARELVEAFYGLSDSGTTSTEKLREFTIGATNGSATDPAREN